MENEYFFKQNFAIFRPELQVQTVRAAISLAKEDNCREESNVFKPGYTGEPLKIRKKTKATPAGARDYLESESDNSDVDEVLKERRRLEKNMVIDKNEEDDIGHLVFGYQQEPGPIVAPPALNDREDLKRHLDNTQAAAEHAQIRALKEVEPRCRLYPRLDEAMKAAIENITDDNNLRFQEWESDVQTGFKKAYQKQALDKMMAGEESYEYSTPQSALNKVAPEPFFYKDCVFEPESDFRNLHTSDMDSNDGFTSDSMVMFDFVDGVRNGLSRVYRKNGRRVRLLLPRRKILKPKTTRQGTLVQPGSESAQSSNAPPEIGRLALSTPAPTTKPSPGETQAKQAARGSTMATGQGATAKTVAPPAAIRLVDNHEDDTASSRDAQTERQGQMDEFTRFLRTISNGRSLTDTLLTYINTEPVYKMTQEQRQCVMTWLVTITVDKRYNQGYNAGTQLFQDIRTAAGILAKAAFRTPWGKNPGPSLIQVKNAQSKVFNGRIRYLAVTAEEMRTEMDDLEEGAKTTSRSLVRHPILETIRAINNWSQYNLEANPQRTGGGDLHVELAAELIEQTFMKSFQNDNNFVNHIESSLSNNVSITVKPWLKQPKVIQRCIIQQLGTIKKSGKQRRGALIYVKIAEILYSIEALTTGPMHKAAYEAQRDE